MTETAALLQKLPRGGGSAPDPTVLILGAMALLLLCLAPFLALLAYAAVLIGRRAVRNERAATDRVWVEVDDVWIDMPCRYAPPESREPAEHEQAGNRE